MEINGLNVWIVTFKLQAEENLRKVRRNNIVQYGTVYIVYRPRPVREAVIYGEEIRLITDDLKFAYRERMLDPTFYIIQRELK